VRKRTEQRSVEQAEDGPSDEAQDSSHHDPERNPGEHPGGHAHEGVDRKEPHPRVQDARDQQTQRCGSAPAPVANDALKE